MTLGIVGGEDVIGRVHDAAESAGSEVVRGPADEVVAADPEAVVAVGESALLALVRAGVAAPVLPVAAGPGYEDIAAEDAVPAVEALVGGEFETVSRTVLGVSVGGERVGPALADAMLVTSEPARISEYAVRSHGEEVARFRADGVVLSTPTGSHGYGRNAGGPVLEPETGVVGVVPVAPFAVDVDHWVLSADRPVELSVERDEGEVSLRLDDRTACAVPPDEPVAAVADGTLDLARVSENRPFFER